MTMPDASTQRPNIVLIMADDMGFSDIGCYGSEIATPNLDRLAGDGVRFSQFYNYARCCPTRASLQTGLYPHRAGIGHMVGDYELPGYRGFLNRNCVTIAEALGRGGYKNLMVGKWHVGGSYRYSEMDDVRPGEEKFPRPLDRGYDRFYGTLAGGGSFFDTHALYRDNEPIAPEGNFYYTDAISEAAVEFLGEYGNGSEPFFMHVCYTAPHWPLHARPEDIAKYRGTYGKGWDRLRTNRHEELVGSGILDGRWPISPRDAEAPAWEDVADPEWEEARMAVYAAQVDRMDQGIGQILAELDRMAIAGNTLVIFLSDNGGCAELLAEDGTSSTGPWETRDGQPIVAGNRPGLEPGPATTFMSYDLPWANASDTPFRYYKHYVHEGGISTPLVARWPDRIAAGRIEHAPAGVMDLLPTFLDMAGVEYPTEYDGNEIQAVDGESFLPALDGREWHRERPIFWEHEGNAAVRQGDWKLVRKWPGDWELYNLGEDRTELNDLAEQTLDRVAAMAALYAEWAARSRVEPWDEVIARPQATPFQLWLKDK
jgi:arylsulfatase